MKLRKVPSLEQLRQAVDDTAGGRTKAAEDLVLFLRAVSRRGNAGLIARAEQVLTEANPRMWILLDVAARRFAVVAHRRVTDKRGSLELLLAACHPDGFVREAAVAAIAERRALPTLALRATDWVPEVRDRARQACQRRLDEAPAEAITFLAPVAFVLRARREGGWLVAALDSLLRDGPPEAMATALAAADWRTRRFAYGIGLSAGRLSVDSACATCGQGSASTSSSSTTPWWPSAPTLVPTSPTGWHARPRRRIPSPGKHARMCCPHCSPTPRPASGPDKRTFCDSIWG